MSPSVSALAVAAALAAAPASRSEIDNVAAFARLYGVVRHFYPSDTAAELDWNGFAVHGVARARPARDAAELEATLEQLVAPLGPGIEIGVSLPPLGAAVERREALVAWRHLGPGFSNTGAPYRSKRTHRSAPAGTDTFVTLMQTVDAVGLRGGAIRLRGQVRATPSHPAGAAALWLRVDRANRVTGFSDNMADRPVRDPEWLSYTIEGTVAEDAEAVAFGVMAMGSVTADFDDIQLSSKSASGDWTPVPIKDAGFEDSTGSGGLGGWVRTGPGTAQVSRPDGGAPAGERFVRFTPHLSGESAAELFSDGTPSPGAHVDLDLGAGLSARVPLVLRDSEARPAPARETDLRALRAALAAFADPPGRPAIDQRLSDVVVTWSALRHFYPYWREAGVDWDGRLRPALVAAQAALTRAAQHDVLRSLLAEARDGHGSVRDNLDKAEQGQLPVGLSVVEGRLVVTASDVPSEAPVGAVVTTIDGVAAEERLARAMRLASGTTQWRQVAAIRALVRGAKGESVELGLDGGARPRTARVSYGEPAKATTRPGPLTELEPGLWYVDLTRAKMTEITPKLDMLAGARGVIFDLRGYPTDAGARILPHLLDAPESDRWMHVAKIVGPFFEVAGWDSYGWDIKPVRPRLQGKLVFLTDGGAISYAESVMGYVADRELATIVGATTAGTNGNVARFTTPAGFTVTFTGMRVTRHDGSAPHHLVGVAPDVAAAPTLAGIRAGRDEVLERARGLLASQR